MPRRCRMRHALLCLFLLTTVCCAKPAAPDQGSAPTTEQPAPGPISSPVPVVPAGVPTNLWGTALAYWQANLSEIPNTRFLTVVDVSKWSGDVWLWIIDMKAGTVEAFHVAHGIGSDPNNPGYAQSFSNIPNSYQSSLGFY